nr:altered inheritance of mitochondria protein 3 [Drosophila virilis]
MLLLVLALSLMSCAQSQEYHYPRPQFPFHLTPQRPGARQQPTKFIVQTFGPHGRTYELQTHKSPAIYVAHETYAVPGHQLQPQRQFQHHVQQPQQQMSSSLYQNPLLVNTNYQAVPVGLTPPPPPSPAPGQSVTYYTQAQAQSNFQQSADSYYRQPQAMTVATATQTQPTASYGPPQEQPHSPHYSNPQPYAVVTLPQGERVLDAGHGSGPLPAESGHSTGPTRVGDYNAQSPSATLDTYNYKQSVPGDTRSYQRYVTNCQPNGQCQQLNLNPGQIDPDHHQLLQAARAQTQPAKGSCQKDNYVPPGAQPNAQGQLRPRDRRTYAHLQEQLAKYPYN